MDIYFESQYGKLNENIEHGEAETFCFECEFGKVQSTYIKRKVPYLVKGEQYFDAITPYGYGGPIVIEASDREKLLKEYTKAYKTHCEEEKIVCEFVRFHPLAENALDFGGIYETIFNRHTIAIDLTDDNYSMVQFSAECRNKIRKAAKKGVSMELDEECAHLDEFIELYYATMDKNSASDYYYFDKQYFEQLMAIDGTDMVLLNSYVEGQIIASAMFMCSYEYMHYHLSSTNPKFYSYAANNLILAEAVSYGQRKGLKWLHLGGGLSGSEKDNLFIFKRNFGRTENNLKDFYIGKAIFMPEIYDALCKIARVNGVENDGFFPEYRKAH